MNQQIRRRGVELLKQRRNFPDELDRVLEILPPMIKMFFTYYETGNWEEMAGPFEYAVLPNIGNCWVVRIKWDENLIFEGESYKDSFCKLLSCKEILFEFTQYTKKTDFWHYEGLVKIGFMDNWDMILLGIENNNLDEIWVLGEAISSGKTHKFANNIFEVFNKMSEIYSDEDIQEYTASKITGSDLYKNWGEDFWRVREKE